jgi:predicted alpha/beta superfamily hydrolase
MALVGLMAAAAVLPGVAKTPSVQSIVNGDIVHLHSAVLGEDRTVDVYLPSSYATSQERYPVVYALDGGGTGPVAASASWFLNGYVTIPRMPEVLVVAVRNTDRNRDMPVPEAYGRGGEGRFLKFLADELAPLIESRYRTQPLRILLGHSQGGTFAHYALATRPRAFPWILALDAPLFRDAHAIAEKIRTSVATDSGFHGRLVSVERLYGWRDEWPSLANAASTHFYAARIPIEGETHETMAFQGIERGLESLFHDYTPDILLDNKARTTFPMLEARYRALSAEYGYPVEIPEALKSLVATQQASVSPQAEAWAKEPPPSPEAMRPFLGAWTEERQDGFHGVLTFAVEGGAVRGRFRGQMPGDPPIELEIAFVRLADDHTLQWGIRNGRGLGVVVHTAQLVHGALEGTTEDFGFPQGGPPTRHFHFERGPATEG